MRVFGLASVLALLALGVACSGGDESSSSPVPSLSPSAIATPVASQTAVPSPSPTATISALDGVNPVPLAIGEEAELPDDVAFLVEMGCFGCDGPHHGLLAGLP